MAEKRKHYGLQTEMLDWQPKTIAKRGGYRPSIEKQWYIARASREGGRCYCQSCGYSMTVTFCKLVSKPLAEDKYICKYCIETKGLKVAA